MNFALGYLVQRFFFRLSEFFHNWYVTGSKHIVHGFISFLERIDRRIALKITIRYYFRPLYKDYTPVGRVLGIVFRSMRIVLGVVIYSILTAIGVIVFLFWLAVPLLMLFFATQGFIYH